MSFLVLQKKTYAQTVSYLSNSLSNILKKSSDGHHKSAIHCAEAMIMKVCRITFTLDDHGESDEFSMMEIEILVFFLSLIDSFSICQIRMHVA